MRELCSHNSVRCNACLSPVQSTVLVFVLYIAHSTCLPPRVFWLHCVVQALTPDTHTHTHTCSIGRGRIAHRIASHRIADRSREDRSRGTCCVASAIRTCALADDAIRAGAVCKTRAVGGIAHSNGSRSLRFRTPAESRRIASPLQTRLDYRNTPVC